MKIVLDTNVLVAGLLSPYGPCGETMRMVSSGELILCLDARVLAEYSEVLRRPKFGFDEDKVAALLDYIEYRGQTVAASPLSEPLPDPDDEPFLEIALACGAEYLVTGNASHFPTSQRRGVAILPPREFVESYTKRQQSGDGA